MAKKSESRTFNVSVIGLSGTEREKGQYGVGKSCLCNRFISQVADRYHREHISVLSQSDFAGRVINNDHFLYWGSIGKTDEGNNFTFQIVEQTEFIDDVSFQPFKTGRTEPYYKRCVSTKVTSAEKLMYICKDQLGMEMDSAFEQKQMPEGKLEVNGFICCFDVSAVPQRPVDKQVEFVALLLANALKAKKPVVLATTKNDEADDRHVKEVEKLINRKEFKGSVPVVDTSAHENVNVELAFMTLAHMIDKTRSKPKILPFVEARRQRQEILDVATEAYQNLLRQQVTDAKATWKGWYKKFEKEPDFGHYVDLFGTVEARNKFRQHVKHLRDEQIRVKEQGYLGRLPKVLKTFLPTLDIIGDRSWSSIQQHILRHEDFAGHFVEVAAPGLSWKQTDSFVDDMTENRIPFDLLNNPEAENCFRNHLNELRARHRKRELQRQFKRLLEENPHVTVGKPLAETYIFFVGKDCYTELEEQDRAAVYEQHLAELKQQAKNDLHELFWEKAEVFWALNSSSSTRLTNNDIKIITCALQDDQRYFRLQKLEEDRHVMILNHLGFIQCPSKDRCYYKDMCVDAEVQRIFADKASKAECLLSPVEDCEKALNLVLLGKEGLATDLNKEIRSVCVEDEYSVGTEVYSLDYRPIDGDVSLEQNALATANFKPHGCLCVYNSSETLEYIQESLTSSLYKDLEQEDGQTLHGMPIAVIQALNSSQSEKEREILQDKGQELAAKLHAAFVEISEEPIVGHRYTEGQIHMALQAVIQGSTAGVGGWPLSPHSKPDLRISMCMMCGDPFSVDLPLGPLLSNEVCQVSRTAPATLTLDLYLDTVRQHVEVEAASYHSGSSLRCGLFHGYILAYSVKRKSSFCTLQALARRLPPVPKLLLAVTESGGAEFFADEFCQSLLTAGNMEADRLQAHFMTTTANFQQQTTVFVPFFKECWERRQESEAYFVEPSEEPSPPAYEDRSSYYERRPPAPLPPLPRGFDPYQTNKSSTSNSQSTEDSDHIYEQTGPGHYHSDSDHERASSTSPPPPSDENYEEIKANGERERLVKPSYVKTRRDQYKVWLEHSEEGGWGDNEAYHHAYGMPPNYVEAHHDISKMSLTERRRHMGTRSQSHGSTLKKLAAKVTAPLAVPEPIELADYSLVKDAIDEPIRENDYASVQDALPAGQLHRIRSTKSPLRKKGKGTTDSEDSEVSSLERGAPDLDRMNRRTVPYRKKSKPRSHGNTVEFTTRQHSIQGDSTERLIRDSPSEGSEGTGDELLNRREEEKKKRSFRKKLRSPTSGSYHRAQSPPGVLSDSDQLVGSPPSRGYDDDTPFEMSSSGYTTVPRCGVPSEDAEYDLNDSGHWLPKWKGMARTMRDPDKQRKKEEKRNREDERRRQKEEERRAKEQLKKQKKKKDSRSSAPSQSGYSLENFKVSSTHVGVPAFVVKCVNYIEEEGLAVEGIYRVPGNKGQVDIVTTRYNEDPEVDFHTLEIQVNAVATVLKQFFMDLQDPLIPPALYDELVHAAGIQGKSSCLLAIRGVLKKLEQQNFQVLSYLMAHLHKVAENAPLNNMDSKNLSRCWWPTLMRVTFKSYESMTQYSHYHEVILQTLIDQYQFIFFGGDEV